MRYILKNADRPLLEFSANMQSRRANLQIQKVYQENRALLPLNLTLTNEGVERWLKHRTIPKTAPMWMRCFPRLGCPSTGRWASLRCVRAFAE